MSTVVDGQKETSAFRPGWDHHRAGAPASIWFEWVMWGEAVPWHRHDRYGYPGGRDHSRALRSAGSQAARRAEEHRK